MKTKLIACFSLVLGMALMFGQHAAPASAATSIPVSIGLHEILPMAGQGGGQNGCSVAPDGYCGQGHVVPLGQVTETIEFGPCPGPHCNTRTIYLADGTLILHEDPYFNGCPGGRCMLRGIYGNPGSFTLIDTITGGTGAYAGASGTLNGSLMFAGADSNIQLSGTVLLPRVPH